MQGRFDLTLMDAGGIPNEVWLAARRTRRALELLRGLRTKQRARTRNQVFDNFAGHLFDMSFSGPQCDYPFYHDSGNAFLGILTLDNRDAAPTYQELWSGNVYPYDLGYITGVTKPGSTHSYKRVIEDDDDTPDVIVDPTGRERVYFRSRFLFTPLEGVANDINGISIWFRRDADTTSYTESGSAARTRLYDSKGRKVTMNKTITDILLVEYEFSLTAI